MPRGSFRPDCLTCVVRGNNCFCHLSPTALECLQSLGRPIRLLRGDRLMDEGDASDQVYLVCAGQLKLMTSSSDGRLLILRIAHPGDVLGLAAALRSTSQSLSVEALETCEVKAIPREAFLEFADRFGDVARNTAIAAASDSDHALLSARRLALSGSAAGKLAAVLLELAPENPTAVFSLLLTHEEIGSMAGLSRETVTRLLIRFRRDGLVTSARGRMTLQQPARLQALVH